MRFAISSTISLIAAALCVRASPIVRRAIDYNEICTVGYCTLGSGTTGGSGGPVTTVTTLAQLTAAVSGSAKKIVIVSGTITGNVVVLVGSNTTLLGRNAVLNGVGLRMLDVQNVIVRNIVSSKCLAPIDNIGVQGPTTRNIWIDHCDISSDRTHSKDYYDGSLDITHAVDYVTVSNTYFHDHWKGSLVGHSDNNGAEDKGHLRITFFNNRWYNVYSRGPSFRFGTGHVFNSFHDLMEDGINTRQGAQMLVQNNVWRNTEDCIFSTDGGYANAVGNDYGPDGENTATSGSLTSVPYSYSLMATSSVQAYVIANAGAKLSV